MATKTIKIPSTLHALDLEKSDLPVRYDINYARVRGKIVVKEHPPMTPVELDAEEADRLLAHYGDAAELVSVNKKGVIEQPDVGVFVDPTGGSTPPIVVKPVVAPLQSIGEDSKE